MPSVRGAGRGAAASLGRGGLGLRAHLLILVICVLSPALLIGSITAWQLGAAYQEVADQGLRSGARGLAVAVDRDIEVAVATATALAGSRALRLLEDATIPPGGAGLPAEDEALADVVARATAVGEAFGGWVVLVDAAGRQIFNSLRSLGTVLPRPNSMPWIEQALATGQPVVTNLFHGSVSGQAVLAVVAPVIPRPTAQPPGGVPPIRFAVILAFDPARLASLLGRVRNGEVAGLIQTADGTILARSVGHAAAVGTPAPGWIAGPIARSASGLADGPSLEGPPIVAAHERLDRVPWSVVVTMPLARYSAAWRRPMRRLALGGAVALGLGLLLAGLLARRLLRPVDALAREAEATQAGLPPPPPQGRFPIAEFEALRLALDQAAESARVRAVAEGRLAAAEEAAAALRTERDRARLYFDVAQAVLVVLGPDGRVAGINHHGLAVLGLESEQAALGRDWFRDFLPERLRGPLRQAFLALHHGEAPETSAREGPVLRADGAERLLVWRDCALRDDEGRLVALVAAGEDITERRAAEQRQTVLVREVDHRAKNVLAVVQSILRLTEAERPADFVAAVEGRIGALARAHTLLSREGWAGGALRDLVAAELAPFAGRPFDAAAPDGADAGVPQGSARAGERVWIEGPPLRLVAEAVQPVSLVLHELASNAARHGALSRPGGRLTLRWALQAGGRLRLDWLERGVAVPGVPTRRGFGSRLIMATMAGQLGGKAHFDWQPEGLSCRLDIAADRLARPPGRDGPAEPGPSDEAQGQPATGRLIGRRVMVVEDEPLVAMTVEAELRAAGCRVLGPAGTLREALGLLEAQGDQPPDAAVLDVNLGGYAAFPVADLLVMRGVPVIFATGYGELPEGWSGDGGQGRTALLRKPLAAGALAAALCRLLAEPPASDRGAAGPLPPPMALSASA
ncbi:HWE histidine kinase domain-containing protein [Falsiroseomonas selenitidurans]|uniref:histidine kinase n=1 Tax=Falsiroseomonas selenitidurans TaxID=2716335 RepID=A0ABX1E400_9PROT|nr:HWE histidine kinase domain-containing protein [Falsiroseomonas selenitidurans]NKC31731.1 PAS domain-containing protein [Falsiroseomonas selenitidurans]